MGRMEPTIDPRWLRSITVRGLMEHATSVVRAVEAGTPVEISRRGMLVAEILPATLKDLVLDGIDTERSRVTARQLQRDNVSAFVARAAKGERMAVTKNGTVIGVLGPWERMRHEHDTSGLGDPTAPLSAEELPTPEQIAAMVDAVEPSPKPGVPKSWRALQSELAATDAAGSSAGDQPARADEAAEDARPDRWGGTAEAT